MTFIVGSWDAGVLQLDVSETMNTSCVTTCMFLASYNSNGQFLWAKYFTNVSMALQVESMSVHPTSLDIYISLSFMGTWYFDFSNLF